MDEHLQLKISEVHQDTDTSLHHIDQAEEDCFNALLLKADDSLVDRIMTRIASNPCQ